MVHPSHVERYTVEQVATAIEAAGGVGKDAAMILGCSRRTIYRYIERHPELKVSVDEARQDLVELAEGALMSVLTNPAAKGHLTAVIFTLKCRGKDRGWIDKVTVEHTGDVRHTHTIGLEAIDEEKLDALVELALSGRPIRPRLNVITAEPAEAK